MADNTSCVSVIMPVFNGARFVVEAMRSILGQAVPMEIIVHDDGSTDDTWEVLEFLAQDEPRIRLGRGPNAGPAAARNACLDRARGEFVAFMDHDDIWPAGRLARQMRILRLDGAATGVIGETFIFDKVDATGQPEPSPASRRLLTGLLQAGLFRHAAIDTVGRFDTDLTAADDLDLLLRFVEHGFRLKVDSEIAVFYRLHPGQLTADLQRTGLQTVRALAKSLARRRRDAHGSLIEWRLNDGQGPD